MDLSTHLPSRLIFLANGLALHAYRLYSARLGLRSGDWRIISALGHFGPISYNELVARIRMDRAGISRTVASLLRRGYIIRLTNKSDRRQSTLALTAEGVEVHDKIAPAARARDQRLTSLLTADELSQLDKILRRLQNEVDKMLQETAPTPPAH
jgi:DNA-binding MarR family transcriptional regulator